MLTQRAQSMFFLTKSVFLLTKFIYPPLFAIGRILVLLPAVAFYYSAMKNSHHANWFGEPGSCI